MRISNDLVFNPHPIAGDVQPSLFWANGIVPDTNSTYTGQNIGTNFWNKVSANHIQKYVKVKNDARADDWVLTDGLICQRITYTQFTDGGSTSGTKVLNATIPVGAYLDKAQVANVTGFAGDTSAVVVISGGVDGTDADGYMTGTPDVFTTVVSLTIGVPSGVRTVTTAFAPTVKVTSAADFTNVSAGAMTVTLFYKV
jgi:hypothetical protein